MRRICRPAIESPRPHRLHIRIDAKRQALDALDVERGRELGATDNGGDRQEGEIETIVEVPETVTSQSRHSLTLSGSPRHGKLLVWRLKEHAWKLNLAAGSKAYQNTSRRCVSITSPYNDVLRCASLSDDVPAGFEGHLTQF
jgi:hypothetical protein